MSDRSHHGTIKVIFSTFLGNSYSTYYISSICLAYRENKDTSTKGTNYKAYIMKILRPCFIQNFCTAKKKTGFLKEVNNNTYLLLVCLVYG